MILKISNPRDTIIHIFERPILYKNVVILNGRTVIKFV